MKFNKIAFSAGFVFLTLINLVLATTIWFILTEFSIQFEDTNPKFIWILFAPPALFNIFWIISTIILFDNGNKNASKKLARPVGFHEHTKIRESETIHHRSQLYMILGSILAIIAASFMYYYVYVTNDSINVNRSLIADKAAIKSFANRSIRGFARKLAIYTLNHNTIDPEFVEAGQWNNVFSNKLPCFSDENVVYNTNVLNLEDIHSPNLPSNSSANPPGSLDINDLYKSFVKSELVDSYEFWIDPEDHTHFKFRFKTRLGYEMNQLINYGLIYDHGVHKFTVAPYCDRWLMEYGYYTYDSRTQEFRFEHKSLTANIFENYKITFYVIWTILVTFICIFAYRMLRKLTKSRSLLGLSRSPRRHRLKSNLNLHKKQIKSNNS